MPRVSATRRASSRSRSGIARVTFMCTCYVDTGYVSICGAAVSPQLADLRLGLLPLRHPPFDLPVERLLLALELRDVAARGLVEKRGVAEQLVDGVHAP